MLGLLNYVYYPFLLSLFFSLMIFCFIISLLLKAKRNKNLNKFIINKKNKKIFWELIDCVLAFILFLCFTSYYSLDFCLNDYSIVEGDICYINYDSHSKQILDRDINVVDSKTGETIPLTIFYKDVKNLSVDDKVVITYSHRTNLIKEIKIVDTNTG